MPKHDTRLKYKLPANNNGNDLVLNKNFSQWDDIIDMDLRMHCGVNYERGLAKELMQSCNKHKKRFERKTEARNIIVLVHPFYLHLTHMEELGNEQVKKEADDYLKTLMNFLKLARDRSKLGIAAFETPHHYAAATSLLLEEGLIDKVVFTEFDRGIPLKIHELDEFRNHFTYFGGMYNRLCLSTAIRMMQTTSSLAQVLVIPELVLDSPQDYKETLRTSSIIEVYSPLRGIQLEKIVGEFNLGVQN